MPRAAIKDGLTKQARYRAAKKAAGLKEVRIWTFDTKDPAFLADLQRQVSILNADPEETAVMEWIEDVAAWPSDDE
ncbi:MAG: DUF3018 domain-containing protein [Hyphomicrobiales bacterium]|nr:MAG: DUF3018 domain-containing protein [Hyphomicrobiales bacterium]